MVITLTVKARENFSIAVCVCDQSSYPPQSELSTITNHSLAAAIEGIFSRNHISEAVRQLPFSACHVTSVLSWCSCL
jgi:hypothetical protein